MTSDPFFESLPEPTREHLRKQGEVALEAIRGLSSMLVFVSAPGDDPESIMGQVLLSTRAVLNAVRRLGANETSIDSFYKAPPPPVVSINTGAATFATVADVVSAALHVPTEQIVSWLEEKDPAPAPNRPTGPTSVPAPRPARRRATFSGGEVARNKHEDDARKFKVNNMVNLLIEKGYTLEQIDTWKDNSDAWHIISTSAGHPAVPSLKTVEACRKEFARRKG